MSVMLCVSVLRGMFLHPSCVRGRREEGGRCEGGFGAVRRLARGSEERSSRGGWKIGRRETSGARIFA
jgi:hypothetical protein